MSLVDHFNDENFLQRYERKLCEFVEIESSIGYEQRAAEWVAKELAALGIEPDLFEPDLSILRNHQGFVDTGLSFSGRPCVCARIKGNGKKKKDRSLILNAHIDTVPVDNDANWLYPPHQAVIQNRKLYGRGAWDDKAGVIMGVALAEAFIHESLPGNLILQFVCDDEQGGNGTLAAIERGYRAEGAIVIDGTWPLRIITDHMGQVWFDIGLKGRSAPACVAKRGLNPIRAMSAVVQELQVIEAQWNDKYPCWEGYEEPNFINVGYMKGGDNPYSVPVSTRLRAQAGFIFPLSYKTVISEIHSSVIDIFTEYGYSNENISIHFSGFDPFLWRKKNDLVSLLKDTIEKRMSEEVMINPVTGHCDLRHFYMSDICACLYGPGGGGGAHVENEYYRLDDFSVVAKNIAEFIMEWM